VNIPNEARAILLARLPALIQAAARDLQRLTGVEVVAVLADAGPEGRSRSRNLPPVHPRCAESRADVPCRPARAMPGIPEGHGGAPPECFVRHCPAGRRCASVPVVVGREVLGTANLVSGPGIPLERFRLLAAMLTATVARPCQEFCLRRLDTRVSTLQRRMRRVLRSRHAHWDLEAGSAGREVDWAGPGAPPPPRGAIGGVLDYLREHYREPGLTLTQVAEAVGMNEKYVSHLFTLRVGERMWTHVLSLRVHHAGALLVETDLSITEVAHDAGFARPAHFRRAFGRVVGVSPSGYRRLFAGRTATAMAGEGSPA